MLRVAVESTALLEVRTGVGTFVNELLERLGRRSDVDTIGFGFTRIYLDQLRDAMPAGVRSTRHAIPARTTRQLWLHANRPTIEHWTGPVDVVHGANFVVPPARHAAEIATVHDLTPVRFPELCDANTRQYPSLIRRAVGRGAHLHTVSQFVADEVQDVFKVAPERVHVVPNGVAPVAGGDPDRGRAHAGGDSYVLAIGTVEPRKSYPSLVAAFESIAATDPDVRLVIAGRDAWGADALTNAIDRAHHRNRISRLGFVDDGTRADLLAGAAVLAYPSIYEGFGLPPLEAMQVGIPVVATATGALPEVVADAAVLVPVNDADALAGALQDVLTNEALAATLIARGHARSALFTWDRTATEVVELYRLIAATGR